MEYDLLARYNNSGGEGNSNDNRNIISCMLAVAVVCITIIPIYYYIALQIHRIPLNISGTGREIARNHREPVLP